MKVSIIVPIYNCEKYLKKCINSILNQTYKNIEVILINDGSDDSSGKICDRYAKKFTCIKVFHTVNSGVSNARNIGIKNSTGDYIQFVDSDDYIKSTMTEKLLKSALKNNSDMVICGYKTVFKYRTKPEIVDNINRDYKINDFLYKLLEAQKFNYFNSPVNKLYKANIIKANNIIFRKDISLGEDLIFNLEYIKCSRNFSTIKECLYIYMVSNNTYSLTKKKRLDIWNNCKILFKEYKQTYIDLGFYGIYSKKVNAMIIRQVEILINIIFRGNFSSTEINIILQDVFNDKLLRSIINNMELTLIRHKFLYFCIKYRKFKFLKFKFYFKIIIKNYLKHCLNFIHFKY